MPQKLKAILLFGPPGSGKGTQGSVLGSIPGFYHCTSGNIFRQIDKRTQHGRLVHGYLSSGDLLPDEMAVGMWHEFMQREVKKGKFDPAKHILLLDGIPRTVEQAQIIKKYIDVVSILHFVCKDEKVLIQRLSRRSEIETRADDASLEVIQHRLNVYHMQTTPMLQFYSKDLVDKIDAQRSPLVVMRNLLDALISRKISI